VAGARRPYKIWMQRLLLITDPADLGAATVRSAHREFVG
jgi:hypothetical protein